LIDAAGAVASSGLGFVFCLMDAMVKAAIKQGFSQATSLDLVAQVFKGCGEMALQGTLPETLKHHIATPGGITAAGFSVMKELSIEAGLQKVVEAAVQRAQEMVSEL
jgi:pyrroline-5-carboxylate reductase